MSKDTCKYAKDYTKFHMESKEANSIANMKIKWEESGHSTSRPAI